MLARRRFSGAKIENASPRERTKLAKRKHAADPNSTNAANPAQDFSRFQGRRGPPIARPVIVAPPSPKASNPQPAAAMSGRFQKAMHNRMSVTEYAITPGE